MNAVLQESVPFFKGSKNSSTYITVYTLQLPCSTMYMSTGPLFQCMCPLPPAHSDALLIMALTALLSQMP
eukprot:10125721-Ditylum_brightwellii.AAC.1